MADCIAVRFFFLVVILGFGLVCQPAYSEVAWEYYEGQWSVLPDFDTITPLSTGTIGNFDITSQVFNDDFAFRFTGHIQIATSGTYTFYTESDDGSRLYVNEQLVVDNDGLHAPEEQSGSVYLEKGYHAITVTYFEWKGGEILRVSYQGPGIAKQIIPEKVLFVSAPGEVTGGSIAAWGSNDYGKSEAPEGTDFVQVAGGAWHSVGLRSDGSIVAWGSSEDGRNRAPTGSGYSKIACGSWHSAAIAADGSLVAWGNNDNGQCDTPTEKGFVDISCGGWHNLAIRSDGSIVAWGYNGQGECDVPEGNDYVAVSAGQDHSLALKSDGSIVGWGSNTDGQSDVPEGNDFVAILAAGRHSIALKSDGSLVSWGMRSQGQLNVPPGKDFAAVVGKWNHHLAMKSDGSVVAWGYNAEGQCNIPQGYRFMNVAGAMYHSLAVATSIFHVDDDATGANDGSSWDNAFTDLQDALAAATAGDEILVAKGIYTPAGADGERMASFHLKSGVTITGGFAGIGYENPDQRDVIQFASVLSGDLAGDDDGSLDSALRAENVYHVVTSSGADGTAVLDGFMITGGNAYNNLSGENDCGGGIYNNSGSPTIVNCIIIANTASDQSGGGGGGMYNRNGQPHLIRCRFINNAYLHADDDGGGGMCNSSGSPVLQDCTFIGNYSSGYGGAMWNYKSNPELIRCEFVSNEAAYRGGAIKNESSEGKLIACKFRRNKALQGGGAISNEMSSPSLTDCIFTDNKVSGFYSDGGAICNLYFDRPVLTDCVFKRNNAEVAGAIYSYHGEYVLKGCIFEENSSTIEGGAIYNRAITAEISGCVFSRNSAPSGGAVYNFQESVPTIDRCIFRKNTATGGGGAIASDQTNMFEISNCLFAENKAGAGGAIYNDDCKQRIINSTFADNTAEEGSVMYNDENNIELVNCILWDNRDATGQADFDSHFAGYDVSILITSSCVEGWLGGTVDNNTGANPKFAAGNEYRLSAESPCVDTGDNSVVTAGMLDLGGKERIFGETVDMGAYEVREYLTFYVDDDAAGAKDGSSWDNAFDDLQDALAVASWGDRILMGQGRYTPAEADGDEFATFQLVNGVRIEGGYAGFGATDPDERDLERFKTVLSGDLNGDDEAGGIIQDNCRHVVTGSGTHSNTVLDGLVISDGKGLSNGGYGGGLYNDGGSPTVLRCVFTKIRGTGGYFGNAIYAKGQSYPFIANCIFEGGDTSVGLTCENPATPTVINCVFLDCSWAAIKQYGGTPLIANCVFAGCQWAFFLDYSNADIRNCLFFGNDHILLPDGGAEPVFTNCIEEVDPMFVDRFSGDYRLQADSPCIDAGDNSVIQTGWVDLDGNERILNDTVDIGVYETVVPEVVESDLRITPRTINRNNRQARILARVRLPETVTIEMIDRNHPLVLLPGEIQTDRMHVLTARRSEQKAVYVFGFFDVDKLLDAAGEEDSITVTVTGGLQDGRLFSGSCTVRTGGRSKLSPRSSERNIRTDSKSARPKAKSAGTTSLR